MAKATEILAKATREALNSSPEVAAIIMAAEQTEGVNAEDVKQALYNMLWVSALMNDEGLFEQVEAEIFDEVAARIA